MNMDTQPEDKKTPTEETAPAPSETVPPPEEPIVLNQIFPDANRDLDALFPDPNMKKLLKDVIRNRQRNERFLKKVTLDELPPEEDDDAAGPLKD
jgi:hypothetical protein